MPVVQAVNAAPSMLQANPLTGSLAVKPNVAVVAFTVPAGPEVIVTTGAVVSTVQPAVAGVGSVWPLKRARMLTVWLPSGSTPVLNGLVQAAKAPPSTEHSKVAPAWS